MANENAPSKRTRKTAEQRAAEFQRKANKARAQATKQKRAVETRRSIALGKGLLELAGAGDSDAERLIKRIDSLHAGKEGASQSDDGSSKSVPQAPDAADWERRINSAFDRHAAAESSDKATMASEWRQAVAGWERCTGKLRFTGEKRAELRLGALGEVKPGH